MKRSKLNPDQFPLITPDTDWKVPGELPDLTRVGEIALDTETRDDGLAQGRGPGWVYGAGHVAGVGVAWRNGAEIRRIYVPVTHPDTNNFPKENVARWVKAITRKNRVILMNGPYDIGWLNADMDVPVPPLVDDIGCMAVMIDETRRPIGGFPKPYALDAICNWLGVEGKDESLLREAGEAYGFAPGDIKANMWRMPARFVGPYGEQDPVATMMCADRMWPSLLDQGLVAAYELEMRLIPMVHAMRKRGIRIDLEAAERFRDQLFARRDAAFEQLRSRLGGRAPTMEDIGQNTWLQRVFGQENVEFNVQGDKASFGKEWMRQGYVGRYEEGRQGHWLPQLIAEAKQCHVAASKFLQGMLLDFSHRGRIHASINQFKSEDGGTRTHRFSYSDPALQQAPNRGEQFLRSWSLTLEIAQMFRGCMLPEQGEKWFSPDYSQQEYRLIVHYASVLGCSRADEAVAKYVNDPNTDFHNMVVDMTGLMRQQAKDTNFAKSYGAGIKKFADMIGQSEEKATEIMNQYDGEMPFVKELMTRAANAASRRGYIVMLDGARMHFNEWEPSWLSNDERQRGWREGWDMLPCPQDEASLRTSGRAARPYRAGADSVHPWKGKRLKRAFTRKAGNGLIQGGAARMTKKAMADVWDAGFTPLLQMHDELPLSVGREADGKSVAQIMREAFVGRVPFRVDEEYGCNWADAKHEWKKARAAK